MSIRPDTDQKLLKKFANFYPRIPELLLYPVSLIPFFNQTDFAFDSTAAPQALLIVSLNGQIQFATAQASVWMRDRFTAPRPWDRLPEALARWFHDGMSGGPSSIFIADQSGRRLSIRFLLHEMHSVCLLLEDCPEIFRSDGRRNALTRRQTEVLSWVSRGKTNAEIGALLNLKTRTVSKYLERIFPKLGVENRTAAASFVVGTDRAP